MTRAQLASLEDDNRRLRVQLSNLRKRLAGGAAEERCVASRRRLSVSVWGGLGKGYCRVKARLIM